MVGDGAGPDAQAKSAATRTKSPLGLTRRGQVGWNGLTFLSLGNSQYDKKVCPLGAVAESGVMLVIFPLYKPDNPLASVSPIQ